MDLLDALGALNRHTPGVLDAAFVKRGRHIACNVQGQGDNVVQVIATSLGVECKSSAALLIPLINQFMQFVLVDTSN